MRPNFFIVGAPKCGTTSLYTYLAQHPDVYMSPMKEPYYFATDLDSGSAADARVFVRTERHYLSLFSGAESQARVGEASVWYLYSTVAAQRIREFSPEAKIIIMLRDPVEMLHSLHAQRYYNGNENIKEFARALDAEAFRKRGEKLTKRGSIAKGLWYREVARYTPQVKRFLHHFDRTAIKVILFDDLQTDTPAVFAAACDFLDIDSTYVPNFKIKNVNTSVRSAFVRDLLIRPPPWLLSIAKKISPGPVRSFAKRMVSRSLDVNTKTTTRVPIESGLRDRLASEYRPGLAELGTLIDRDLSHWCET